MNSFVKTDDCLHTDSHDTIMQLKTPDHLQFQTNSEEKSQKFSDRRSFKRKMIFNNESGSETCDYDLRTNDNVNLSFYDGPKPIMSLLMNEIRDKTIMKDIEFQKNSNPCPVQNRKLDEAGQLGSENCSNDIVPCGTANVFEMKRPKTRTSCHKTVDLGEKETSTVIGDISDRNIPKLLTFSSFQDRSFSTNDPLEASVITKMRFMEIPKKNCDFATKKTSGFKTNIHPQKIGLKLVNFDSYNTLDPIDKICQIQPYTEKSEITNKSAEIALSTFGTEKAQKINASMQITYVMSQDQKENRDTERNLLSFMNTPGGNNASKNPDILASSTHIHAIKSSNLQISKKENVKITGLTVFLVLLLLIFGSIHAYDFFKYFKAPKNKAPSIFVPLHTFSGSIFNYSIALVMILIKNEKTWRLLCVFLSILTANTCLIYWETRKQNFGVFYEIFFQ